MHEDMLIASGDDDEDQMLAHLTPEERARWKRVAALGQADMQATFMAGLEAIAKDSAMTEKVIASHRARTIQNVGRSLGGTKGLEAAGSSLIGKLFGLDASLVMKLAEIAFTLEKNEIKDLNQDEVDEIFNTALVTKVMEEGEEVKDSDEEHYAMAAPFPSSARKMGSIGPGLKSRSHRSR